MKKSSIINKGDIMTCWTCSGLGYIDGEICDLCNGSGKWLESHYIVVDEVNKIAIDSDTGA